MWELKQRSRKNTPAQRGIPPVQKNLQNPYAAYDAGYDDVMEGDDYDWDRYRRDSEYADGVDDAWMSGKSMDGMTGKVSCWWTPYI